MNREYSQGRRAGGRPRGGAGTGRQPGNCAAAADASPTATRRTPATGACKYLRYADDHILGFIGPKAEAEEIKAKLAAFLRETLALELNQAKTLITHARTRRGAVPRLRDHRPALQHETHQRLQVGQREDRAARTAGRDQGQVRPLPAATANPWHRPRLQNLDDYDIVRIYGAEYRGIVNYYLLAQDVWRLGALRWNAETSLLKTLAAKHHSTVTKMAARHKAKIETSDGLRTCFEARKRPRGQAGPGSTIRRDTPAARTGGRSSATPRPPRHPTPARS